LRLKRVVLPFLLFFISLYYVSAQSNELTLDEAINLALESNLSLRRSEIDLAASSFSEGNLWALFFPTISASARVGYSSSFFSESPRDAGANYRIGFDINLGLNAGIPHAMRSIRLAHQANILRYEDARNQLSILITKRFYALVAEKNNLTLLEEILNLAERQVTRSETLFRYGFAGELSLMQSRLAFENARFNLSAARILHDSNMAEFMALLGISDDQDITLIGEFNIVRIEVNADALIREYLPQRPDIVRGRQEIERLQNTQMQTVMQTRAPSLNLSGSWSSSSFYPFSDSFSASANVSIPIDPWITGTSRNQTISAAADSVEKARLDLQMAENAAITQIRSLSASLRNSWDNIRIARLGYEVAQRSYQLTEHGFLNGTIEALTLEDARNNLTSARQRLLQTELSYFNMILDLSAAINVNWKYLIQIYGVPSE
jgi:outer membrane protein TolC